MRSIFNINRLVSPIFLVWVMMAQVARAQVPAASSNTGSNDPDKNWVNVKLFDEQGNVIGDSRQFYDPSGELLQMQRKVKYRKDNSTVHTHVMAAQPLRDALGRVAAYTLPAPIDNSEFIYQPSFVRNGAGNAYNFKNFDRYYASTTLVDVTNNPDPVGAQSTQGTLGWYYSANNNWEPYTPVTNYPYKRVSFYEDGSGTVKKMAQEGEPFKMGSGHEVSAYVVPVVNELSHYVQVRNKYFTTGEMGALPTTLANEAMLGVGMDANGREGVTISDKAGNVLMTARPGTGNAATDLQVSNTVSLAANEVAYFKIFSNNSSVSITGSDYTLYDMNTETAVSLLPGNLLNKGYYKLAAGSQAVSLTYVNWYTDVGYLFYNHLGSLMAVVPAEGVIRLLGTGINNYATKASVPYITYYDYDVQGRLIRSTTADAGFSDIVYRRDGKVRFSQNAAQRTTGRYHYTNYDSYGRAIESGEYQPDGGGITFNADLGVSSAMRNILEDVSATGGLTTGTKRDVVVTKYDLADNTHGVSGYTQDAAYLGGVVSMSRKYSSIVNNTPNSADIVSTTWYNYIDGQKLAWTIQYIAGLGYKTTDFEYDAMDNLTKKVFQKQTAAETFVHYYEYDNVNKQLWKIYTNTVDNVSTRKLHATYVYYLHGPLKRIELADNLQGIDYTYTLQGALKAINNSDKTKDPGRDGISNSFQADAFGMVLDYHPNDYQNTRGSVQSITGVNTAGITTESYAGHIKAQSWFSKKPPVPGLTDNPLTYIYKYDDKYQFNESIWGSFVPAPGTFTPTAANKESVKHPVTGVPAYDANGNIQYLQRTDGSGTVVNKFSYTYPANNNRLQSITHDNNGTPQTYASYVYDQAGQMVEEQTGDINKRKYLKYDASGKVILVTRDAAFTQKVAEFAYNELGQRIIKRTYNAAYQLAEVNYYLDDVVFTQNAGTAWAVVAQEYNMQVGNKRLGQYYRPSNVYAYELNDHQGNVRAVVATNGSGLEVRMYADYYPYGLVVQKMGDYRHGFQGRYSEHDQVTDWNAFELRMYDAKIARWFTTDPANQFASPYAALGNNPVNGFEKDGDLWFLVGAAIGAISKTIELGIKGELNFKNGAWKKTLTKIGTSAVIGGLTGGLPTGTVAQVVVSSVGAGALNAVGEVADQAIDMAYDPNNRKDIFDINSYNGGKVLKAGIVGALSFGGAYRFKTNLLSKTTRGYWNRTVSLRRYNWIKHKGGADVITELGFSQPVGITNTLVDMGTEYFMNNFTKPHHDILWHPDNNMIAGYITLPEVIVIGKIKNNRWETQQVIYPDQQQ